MDKVKTYIFPSGKINNFLARNNSHVGRKQISKDIHSALDLAYENGGSFLVAGYRGVGKTSVVKKQIKELEKKNNCETSNFRKIKPFYINLGSDSKISPKAIMSEMAEQIQNDQKSQPLSSFQRWFYFCYFLACIFLLGLQFYTSNGSPLKNHLEIYFLWAALGLSMIGSVLLFISITNITNVIIRKADSLIHRISYERSFEIAASTRVASVKTALKENPITTRGIDLAVQDILNLCQGRGFQYIFVFDELDKINPEGSDSETKDRKQRIDEMLGGLKALITGAKATFIFIAGREMMDSYHAEHGYTSGLYEGVFTDVFYIPTLLSDHSDSKERILHSQVGAYVNGLLDIEELKKGYAKGFNNPGENPDTSNVKFVIRVFIRYLTLHSWGNCKRLESYVRQFVELDFDNKNEKTDSTIYVGREPKKGESYFKFRSDHIRNFFHAAKIYSLLDNQITHQLALGDDKLIVSTLVSSLDLMKFHDIAFSREMLDRTIEGIDIHSESSLPNIITDLIGIAFSPIIRRTPDNIFSYRFYSVDEEEFSYISRVLGPRAASQEFTLDSAKPIKRHYSLAKSEFMDGHAAHSISHQTAANIDVIMGDLYFWEGRLDEAYLHYSRAIPDLKTILRNPSEEAWRHEGGVSFSTHYILIVTLLKKGLIDERRENYELAARYYREAQTLAQYSFENFKDQLKIRLFESFGDTRNSINLIEEIGGWLNSEGQEDTSAIRHRNMIVHALLAADFLKLKWNKKPRVNIYKNIPFVLDMTDAGMFGKILSLNYYFSKSTLLDLELNKQLDSLFPKGKDDDNIYSENVFKLRYLVGNYFVTDIAKKGASREGFDSTWSNIIKNVATKDFCKHETIDIKHATNGNNVSERISECFKIIYQAAKGLDEKGKYSSAVQCYIALLGHWVSLLEMKPWSTVELSGSVDGLQKPVWFDELIRTTKQAISNSDRGAYERERLTLRGKDAGALIGKTLGLGNPLADSFDLDHAFWYRSTSESYLVALILWEQYARYRIHEKLSGTNGTWDGLVGISSPIGVLPRTTALFNWLKTRVKADKFITCYKSGSEESDDFYIELAEIVIDYYEVILGSKFGSPSDDPDSMPPKAIVYYNLFELLAFAQKVKFGVEVTLEGQRIFEKRLIEMVREKTYETYAQFTLCRVASVAEIAIRHLKELQQVGDYTGVSYRRRIRNKYYLFDDFDDPLYVGEWAQIQLLATGAEKHIKVIEEAVL